HLGCAMHEQSVPTSLTPRCVAFSPDDCHVAIGFGNFFPGKQISSSGKVTVLDAKTLQQEKLCQCDLPVDCLSWTRDGKQVLFGTSGALKSGKGVVRLWPVQEKNAQMVYQPEYSVQAVTFLRNDRIIIGFFAHDEKKTIRVLDPNRPQVVSGEAPINQSVFSIAVHQTEEVAAIGCGDNTIHLIRCDDLSDQAVLKGHNDTVVAACF